MSPALKDLYISTLSFSVALTSSFFNIPRYGLLNTTSPMHLITALQNLWLTIVTIAVTMSPGAGTILLSLWLNTSTVVICVASLIELLIKEFSF